MAPHLGPCFALFAAHKAARCKGGPIWGTFRFRRSGERRIPWRCEALWHAAFARSRGLAYLKYAAPSRSHESGAPQRLSLALRRPAPPSRLDVCAVVSSATCLPSGAADASGTRSGPLCATLRGRVGRLVARRGHLGHLSVPPFWRTADPLALRGPVARRLRAIPRACVPEVRGALAIPRIRRTTAPLACSSATCAAFSIGRLRRGLFGDLPAVWRCGRFWHPIWPLVRDSSRPRWPLGRAAGPSRAPEAPSLYLRRPDAALGPAVQRTAGPSSLVFCVWSLTTGVGLRVGGAGGVPSGLPLRVRVRIAAGDGCPQTGLLVFFVVEGLGVSEKPRNVTSRQAKRNRFHAMRRSLSGSGEGSISKPQVRDDAHISRVVGGVTILGFFDMIGFVLLRDARQASLLALGEPRRSRQAVLPGFERFHPLGPVHGRPALRRAVGGGSRARVRSRVPSPLAWAHWCDPRDAWLRRGLGRVFGLRAHGVRHGLEGSEWQNRALFHSLARDSLRCAKKTAGQKLARFQHFRSRSRTTNETYASMLFEGPNLWKSARFCQDHLDFRCLQFVLSARLRRQAACTRPCGGGRSARAPATKGAARPAPRSRPHPRPRSSTAPYTPLGSP